MKYLITGGAGYIGSTICSALEDSGHTPIILDSLVTGRAEFTKHRIFYQADIANTEVIETIFHEHPDIRATIHCAALIVIPESVSQPYDYYHENVCKSLELFKNLNRLGAKRVVFSSSASIYDLVPGFMVTEDAALNPTNPYARTKVMMEWVLQDFCRAYGMQGIALRYFNPIGADPQMRSGIHVKEPSHIVGKLVETALGKQAFFQITGTEYGTRDGTGIRDYIHVCDLATAHVKALEYLIGGGASTAVNLGTGTGYSVEEVITSVERITGIPVPKRYEDRRAGDPPSLVANADRGAKLLNWRPQHSDIDTIVRSAWRWHQRVAHGE